MNMFIIDNMVAVRLGFFLGIFSLMSAWELLAPRRVLTQSKGIRWFNNLTITVLNAVLIRLVFPVTAIGIALLAAKHDLGAFHHAEMPQWVTAIVAIALLDLTIYTQHVVFHKVPFFWRLHRMHHVDLDIDVTTGSRFHPLEIIISMGVKMLIVIILGPPAWSVVVFEILLNATSMFNHSNARMNKTIDRVLRTFLVTPDMHRVHHSVIVRETDSNFGFNLPLWDRLFGTYRDQPSSGHNGMTIGLANCRDPKWLTLPWMLAVPFFRRIR
ncbi:MAG: sterol desaturase family protein [Thermodesulfovibrionales bacterium]|jgi:sterol desaturase/sphingolipid hydroxylase (fatty acid hydroxylase superfamily)